MAGSCKTAVYCFSLLAILLSAGCSGNDADQVLKPNILLILADDLGNNDLGSWGDGSAPTPTLDQLSQQSVRFRQHYTDSTCSPSRAALLTGREPTSIGFQPTALGLSPDLDTLPKKLQSLGYRTAHIGKWHVGEALEYSSIQPSQHGFDYWFGMLNHFVLKGPNSRGETLRTKPTHWNPWLQENGTPARQFEGYLDDILTEKALGLIEKPGAKPWFINLWLYSPHTPHQPPAEDAAKFPNTPEGRYLAILSRLDQNVSRLLKALQESGQAENTIVVFASDNGSPNKARDSNWPFGGTKDTYLEGGQRSPLLLHWPNHLKEKDIRVPTTIMDIFPTIVALAGSKRPLDIDGQSLVPLIQGNVYHGPEKLFFAIPYATGMSYGGRVFDEGRLFYRPFTGPMMTAAIAPPVGAAQFNQSVPAFPFDAANTLIRDWERDVREVPLTWQPAGDGKPGILSGRSMQRAPIFGGYSIGLSLRGSPFVDRVQTIIEQPGIWQVQLLQDRRLRIQHGDVVQFSSILEEAVVCNKLVVGMQVDAAVDFPLQTPAQSVLRVYWNGLSVLESTALLRRPETDQPLMQPTFIGARADGSEAFEGVIEKPRVINKLLYAEQDGIGLQDLQQQLCTAP
ncbi:sulfatase-like hydrolase/transferase [Pseudomonas sp. SR9]|uniref:Sulfatase-like hydrolase/transferase n=1 Tax=Aquipseudomonas guryensis TaxID=2759165 RepID=A0A7W4D9Y9_9GAMM|nr:sulfatase-like hydrolase/transferase [Pseudomonas guryensis]